MRCAVLGAESRYHENEEHALGRHGLNGGMPLRSPYFPIIYPRSDPLERATLRSGQVLFPPFNTVKHSQQPPVYRATPVDNLVVKRFE